MSKHAPFFVILAALLLIPLYSAASAAAEGQEEETLNFAIDGALYTAPDDEPAPFINHDRRTLVPVSFFAKAMGVSASDVHWDNETKTATIAQGERVVVMTAGQANMRVNDEEIAMDTRAEVVHGRVFIPVRYIAEGLGGSIVWDASTRIVHITTAKHQRPTLTPDEARQALGEQADAVLSALADKDMKTLASYVHPSKGVRFTPYTHVDMLHQVRLTPAMLEKAFDAAHNYVWGLYDGSGEPIELSFSEYYEQFIYPHNFIDNAEISYNEPLFSGNMINNAALAYPGSIIVEYHIEAINPDYGGLDWQSLRLVFEQLDERWLLVGIINDQWTI
ncbi:copper amine oxidase N-terminal domain-containing protein [Paenibacillaceae bacterium]|nr:copper amine oxidase N-terminal domain-containing protein [Paenibacillaceae bacterium]